MQNKSKKMVCKDCGALFSSRPAYQSHVKLCISMNEYQNGLLLNSPFSLRPMFVAPRRRSASYERKSKLLKTERRKRSSEISWHSTPTRRKELRERYSKCGDPCCMFSAPKETERRSATSRSPVNRMMSLPSPERNILGNLSINLKAERKAEEEDDGNLSSVESGGGRRNRKEVSYFCKPCEVTLASWQSIRKHLLSSEHLLTVSPERRLQIASTARRKRSLFPSSQPSLPSTDHPVKEVLPMEKISTPLSPTSHTPPLKVRFDYKESTPKGFTLKNVRGMSKTTKDNRQVEEAYVLTKENTEIKDKVNSRSLDPSECQKKVDSSLPEISGCQRKVNTKLQVSESQGKVDLSSQEMVSECQEVNRSIKSPSITLGHRCDSLEFLKDQCSSEVVRSMNNEALLSRKSLYKLFLHRERVMEAKQRLRRREEMKKNADAGPKVSTMIRYDYKKSASGPQYCTASKLIDDGRELNLTLEGQRRISPDTSNIRRCLFQENSPGEGTSNQMRFADPQVSSVTSQSSCSCSCHSLLERHAIMMLLKEHK